MFSTGDFAMSNNLGTSNMGSSSLGQQHLAVPNNRPVQITPISSLQHTSVSNNLGPQHLTVPNSRPLQIAPISSLQHTSVSNKRTIQMISTPPTKPGSQKASASNKRGTKVEPTPNNGASSQKLSMTSKRSTQMEPSPKAKSESFESVRAKMRESLASALALVSEEPNKTVEKDAKTDVPSTASPSTEVFQPSGSNSAIVDVGSSELPEKPVEQLPIDVDDYAENINDGQILSDDIFSIKNETDVIRAPFGGQEFQFNYVLHDEDLSFSNNFFAKDDLLQGNGLCWASDLDLEILGEKDVNEAKRPKLEQEVKKETEVSAPQSPKILATKIEAELFKVFGGVNKKYKEKGRSLLFNLKDPSNPELRERVVSGEISPERLCSMTAEELASKELSEWRIAKAEELAQMVVLPDSEVDIRRLVRKTHKGEFQVEFEQDDSASVEVTIGVSSLSQFQPKTKKSEAQNSKNPDENGKAEKSENTTGEKVNLDDTVSSDVTDPMQGLMVDEMKDAEFLPPIVSLDEFMESLDSEPPFENLQKGMGASEEKKSSLVDSKSGSPDRTSVVPAATTTTEKSDKMEGKHTRTNSNLESNEIHAKSEIPIDKGEHVWEGTLQLNISSAVTVGGYFKSGEKTSTKDWLNSLDIKGRVRLDAFEKFLQELRMSRSRGIMVVHLCLMDDSSESARESLREVVESYISDERVGFAEPAPAMELYLCPPHIRTIEMLGKNLPKDQIEKLNALDKGLIGIVIWRKVHVSSTISPNSSSHHHKHSSSKKQQNLKKQTQEKETKTNANPPNTSSILGPPPGRNPNHSVRDEPIDDIPPGFGPSFGKDDDDLPEFEFAGGSNANPPISQSSAPKVPQQTTFAATGQMRELIQKYGNNEMSSNNNRLNWQQSRSLGIEVEPWNDDDDIPEWQPQQQITPPPLQQTITLPPPPPPPAMQQALHLGFQQQMLPLPHGPLMAQQFTQQTPMNMMQIGGSHQNMASTWQAGGNWPQQIGQPLSIQQQQPYMNTNLNGQPFDGQFYGNHPPPQPPLGGGGGGGYGRGNKRRSDHGYPRNGGKRR